MSLLERLTRRGYSAYLLDIKNKDCKKHRRYYRISIKILAKITKHGIIKIDGIGGLND